MPPPWDSDDRPWLMSQLVGLEETIYLGTLATVFSWIFRALPGNPLNWVYLTLVLVSWLIERRRVNQMRSLVLRWLSRLMPFLYFGACIAVHLYVLKNCLGFVSGVILGMLLAAGIATVCLPHKRYRRRIVSLILYFAIVVGWSLFFGQFTPVALSWPDIVFLFIPLINATKWFISGMGLLVWQPVLYAWYQTHLSDIGFPQLLSWLWQLVKAIVLEVLANLISQFIL